MIRRILTILIATTSVALAQTTMKYDNFTHAVNKPPVSAGSAYDYDFTGLIIHGITAAGTPGGSNSQFQYNSSGSFAGTGIYTTSGSIVQVQADKVQYLQSSDSTKKWNFDGSAITAGQNRTVKIPDANTTTVAPDAGAANNFLTGISNAGVITKAQVAAGNLADLGGASRLIGSGSAANSVAQITLGTSMSMSGTTLDFSGSAVALTLTGTLGLGYLELFQQSSAPATPTGQHIRLYDTAGGSLAYLTSSGFSRSFSDNPTMTANRVVNWPDATTTIPVFGQTITFAGPTAARTVTFPDANFTAARTDAANTFTGHQTIEGVTSTGATGTGNYVFSISPALTGNPTAPTQTAGDNSTKLATTAYVDTTEASFDAKPSVAYASTSALPSNTYANGASGVGATLTATANGPLVIDGVTLVVGALNSRILVAGEATAANNGWYTLTQLGVVAVSPYILTRDVLSDQAAEIGAGYLTSVIAPNSLTPGSSNNGKVFISVAADPFTVGTTSLTFSQVGSTYAAGNGLSLSGSTFSIDTSITVDKNTAQVLTNKDLTSGTNAFPTLNQNTTGSAAKLTTARNIGGVAFDGTANIVPTNISGGNGTTLLGSMPYQSATDTTTQLGPNTTTTKKFLRQTGDGTNGAAPAWDTIAAGDVPTLNQNTTGSAATLTTSRNINGVAFNGSAAIVAPAVSTAGLFSVVNTGATNWTESGTVVQANGTSTSGSAGTTVADLVAAANSQIVAWSAFAAQSNTANTQLTITVTYSDSTTMTATSSAATSTTAFANAGGIMLNTAAETAGGTKLVTEIKVITAGTGTGTRSAIISGLQVPR